MARLKSYYTTDEITNDLYTFGKEFMTRDNVEYIGPYHRYVTGEIYTDFKWNPKTSLRLIAYVDIAAPTTRYRELKEYALSYDHPIQMPCTPNAANIYAGSITRYFISKINDNTVVEVNAEQYQLWQQGKIDRVLYSAVSINWAISGPLQDRIENGITIPGVVTRNRKTIHEAMARIPIIQSKLTNLTEFYTDADFIVPKDINNLES
jgi:hypothetical protein